MTTQNFRYIQIGSYFRPIILVTLQGSKSFDYFALIDSGADFTMFHADIAELIGVDLNKLQKMTFGGIQNGKTSEAFYTAINLELGYKTLNIPVMFSPDISDNGYGVLGQLGFFNRFKVTFDYRNKNIHLH